MIHTFPYEICQIHSFITGHCLTNITCIYKNFKNRYVVQYVIFTKLNGNGNTFRITTLVRMTSREAVALRLVVVNIPQPQTVANDLDFEYVKYCTLCIAARQLVITVMRRYIFHTCWLKSIEKCVSFGSGTNSWCFGSGVKYH